MSAWLSSFSLPNPFKSDSDSDDGNGYGEDQDSKPSTTRHSPAPASPNSTSSPTSGVKQDLSALSQTFSHHLRGVAAFLAPPPASQQQNTGDVSSNYTSTATGDGFATAPSASESETITGIRKDLEEIGGSFKSLFSSSSNKAVSGISKLASNILQVQDDVIDEGEEEDLEEEDIAGISEEVLDFARQISLRPELWTDFPLSLPNDFDMSDNQRSHAATIEDLVPSIVTLRQTCSHLSDGQFWMIYFILLLPRLNETDMELLSTSEIIEVRETLLLKLQNKTNAQAKASGISETVDTPDLSQGMSAMKEDKSLSEQRDVSAETANTTKEREVETGKNRVRLKDEDADLPESLDGRKHAQNEDDVSFSDLEDDDDNDLSDKVPGVRRTQSGRGSSASESSEWVRLTENSGAQGGQNNRGLSTRRGKDSEGEESNDWLTVDDIDLDSLAAA